MEKDGIYYPRYNYANYSGRLSLSRAINLEKFNVTPFKDIAILGANEAYELCKNEPNKWCAVSICLPSFEGTCQFNLENTKKIQKHYFHDISSKKAGRVLCEEKDIKAFLKFSKECYNEALLIHCAGGISRSTAAAFLIILNSIKDKVKNPAEKAMEMVYYIRPILYPNNYMIDIGIPLIARSKEETVAWFRELYNSRIWQRIRG